MILGNHYKKLHADDETLSRILQRAETADLDAYRNRPEFIQKERPELASVGEPAADRTNVKPSERPGFRPGMSRSLISFFTITAAAALTLLIAVSFIRISAGKGQMSGEADMAMEARVSAQAADQESETSMTSGTQMPAQAADREDARHSTASDAVSAADGNAEEKTPLPQSSAPSISSDSAVKAIRDYYGADYVVVPEEETYNTLRLTVSRNVPGAVNESLTVTVDLLTGDTLIFDEAGSQVGAGTVSEDGIYTDRPD